MSKKQLICKFEPGRFPSSEFAHDEAGELLYPLIHIARVPFHYYTGQLFPPDGGSGGGGSPGGSGSGGTPLVPSQVPPYSISIPAVMVDPFIVELEKFLEGREPISLSELLDFGVSLNLEVKQLDFIRLIEVNLERIPKDFLQNPERFMRGSNYTRPGKLSSGRFDTSEVNRGVDVEGKDGPGGFSNFRGDIGRGTSKNEW